MLDGRPRRSRPPGGRGVSRLLIVVVVSRLLGTKLSIARTIWLAAPGIVAKLVMVVAHPRCLVAIAVAARTTGSIRISTALVVVANS